jgi:transcriptional regulator of acetoin/glycerol metabolism
VVATGSIIQLADMGLTRSAVAPAATREPGTLEEMERRHIAEVLTHTGGNVSQAARVLGIDRVTLYNKMRKYQIRKDGGEDDAAPHGS